MNSYNANDVIQELKKLSTPDRAKTNAWFFKTGEGQYGYGDKFLGVTVPEQRVVAQMFKELDYNEIRSLLHSEVHEHRLTALLILVNKFKKANEEERKKIVDFYLNNIRTVNNWDLVDSSAPQILGSYLKDKEKDILLKFSRSDDLWEKRIAIVSTQAFIKNKDTKHTYAISKILLNDPNDLIHKATGWMLREAGAVNEKELVEFLEVYAPKMPRTMLRYAIEKFDADRRKHFLSIPAIKKQV
jgi:3-methyladenine DNA glycosylase AlkD